MPVAGSRLQVDAAALSHGSLAVAFRPEGPADSSRGPLASLGVNFSPRKPRPTQWTRAPTGRKNRARATFFRPFGADAVMGDSRSGGLRPRLFSPGPSGRTAITAKEPCDNVLRSDSPETRCRPSFPLSGGRPLPALGLRIGDGQDGLPPGARILPRDAPAVARARCDDGDSVAPVRVCP